MTKRNGWRRVLAGLLAVVLMSGVGSLLAITASAADDRGRGVMISSAGQIADAITYNGKTINAVYRKYDGSNASDSTYSCAAFVIKFYQTVWGITVYSMVSKTSIPNASSGSFSTTRSPKVGDIVRYGSNLHWAIVKEVNGDTCTIIHQNGWYDNERTQASVGVKWKVSNTGVTFFTWSGNTGGATPPTSPVPSKPSLSTNKSSYQSGENVTLNWNACDNAAWYDVTITYADGAGYRWYGSDIIGGRTSHMEATVPAGNYRAKVTAVNNSNGTLQINDSGWAYFSVVNPTYTISYNANGGTGAPPSQIKTKDVALTLSSTKPARDGYDFLGWATNSTATTSMYYVGGSCPANMNANITLYAVWVKTYTITYNANGGTGAPQNQTKTQGSAIYLSSVAPTRGNDYVFLRWQDSFNSSMKYQPGLYYAKDENLYLDAEWVQYNQIVQDSVYSYALTANEAILYGINSSASALTYPETLGGRTVTTIRKVAIGNRDITSITIPKGVKSFQYIYWDSIGLGNTAGVDAEALFAYCDKLANIYVNSQNPYFTSVDGVLFNKDITTLIRYPQGKTASS